MKKQLDSRKQQSLLIKTGLVSLTFSLLMACGNGTAEAPKPLAPKPEAPKTPAATKVVAAAPKVELSPEEAELKLGQKVYRKCKSCHTVEDGGRNRVGPNLYGVLGAKIASKDGFAYSKASKASDIIWTDENLDAFLTKPREFLPGNRMTFVGLKKEEDRKAVIAYLHNVTK